MAKKNNTQEEDWYDDWSTRDEESSDWKRSMIREKRRTKYKQRDEVFDDPDNARG